MTTYINWREGDKINICASIDEFCGAEEQFIETEDINVTKQPDTCSVTYGYERGCGLHLNNVTLEFKLVKCSGTSAGRSCNPQQIYNSIGYATTNSDGVCGITYTVTEQDRLDYESQIGDDVYKVMACITDSDGQPTQSGLISKVTDSITISPSHLECMSNICTRVTGAGTDTCITEGSTDECIEVPYTHILELRIRPWGWYTPDGAASKLLTKLYDIDGWCINLVSSLSDWKYIETVIVPDGKDVLIQSRFKILVTPSSQIKAMVVQGVAAIVAKIILVISILLVIIGVVGIITNWKLFETESDPTTSPTYEPPPKDIEPNIETVIADQTDTCLTILPSTPTCADITDYATCLKAAHIGVYGTLIAIKPNFQEFQDTYNKYLNIYTDLAITCDEDTPGKTPLDILNELIIRQQKYINDLKDDFDKLQELYDKLYDKETCCIGIPYVGCIISKELCNTAKTVSYVILGGVGVYFAYNIYTSITPKKE